MSQHEKRFVNTEKCCNEILFCCMPCVGIFWMGENLCKGLLIGCFSFKRNSTTRDVSPAVTHSEINDTVEDVEETEFVDFSEEAKDASYI